MKKKLLLMGCILLLVANVRAQYVSIPDTTFRNFLKNSYPTCFNASDQMDTTCSAIMNATLIDNLTIASGIVNFDGLQYFKNLQDFSYSYQFSVTTIPAFPKKIIRIFIDGNLLTSLPPLPDSLRNLTCGRNQLQSLPPLPPKVYSITCGENNLSSLPPLPDSLITFYCGFNNLTALVALPVGLRTLEVNNNFLTTLPPLPDSLKGLNVGSNLNVMLPASLPAALNALSCYYTNISSLPSLPDSLHFIGMGGNPYLFCLPHLPFGLQSIQMDTNRIRCLPNAGPFLKVYPHNIGTPLLSYQVCNVTNNTNGCQSFPQIFGFIFNDNNSNGVFDGNDVAKRNIRTQLSTGEFSYTNDTGTFYFSTDTLGSFSTTILSPPFFTPIPLSNVHSLTSYGDAAYDTFALQPDTLVDSIAIHISPLQANARPGFPFAYHVEYENVGTTVLHAPFMKMKFDSSLLTYDSTSLNGVIQNADSLLLNADSLLPGQFNSFVGYFHVKTSATIDSLLEARVAAVASMALNADTTVSIISAAYDPNSKSATPDISTNQIAAGKYIEYYIHFQNVGNDTAFNVVISDSLSPRLQTNFLQMLATSHPCRTTLNNGVVYFEFLSINLPDSGANQIESNGFVRFRMKPDTTLSPGEVVFNTATISFDYNTAITTNTCQTLVHATLLPVKLLQYTATLNNEMQVLNKWLTTDERNMSHFNIQYSLNGKEFKTIGRVKASGYNNAQQWYGYADHPTLNASATLFYRIEMVDDDNKKTYSEIKSVTWKPVSDVSVFPNPSSKMVILENNDIQSLRLIDNAGRAVLWKTVSNEKHLHVDVSNLPHGLYLLQLTKKNKTIHTQKLVIE